MSAAEGTLEDALRPLSHAPGLHFFGYYGIDPWDEAGARHLALEIDDDRAMPQPGDRARVGWIRRTDGRFEARTTTTTFNLQQGAMLHWLDDGSFSVNDLDAEGRPITRILDPTDGTERRLEAALAALSPRGDEGIGLDYARMRHCRRVVGYATPLLESAVVDQPSDDGLWHIDLASGAAELLLPIAEVAARCNPPPGARVWFNHACYAPDGEHLLFFCRFRAPSAPGFTTSVWTLRRDGGDLRPLTPPGVRASHYWWLDQRRVLLSTDLTGVMGFHLIDRETGAAERFGHGRLPADGHPCLSRDGRWLLGDTYPEGPERLARLWLYDLREERFTTVARLPHPDRYRGDLRCDLHPRWHPDGRHATIDSVHTGSRQIHLVDLAASMAR